MYKSRCIRSVDKHRHGQNVYLSIDMVGGCKKYSHPHTFLPFYLLNTGLEFQSPPHFFAILLTEYRPGIPVTPTLFCHFTYWIQAWNSSHPHTFLPFYLLNTGLEFQSPPHFFCHFTYWIQAWNSSHPHTFVAILLTEYRPGIPVTPTLFCHFTYWIQAWNSSHPHTFFAILLTEYRPGIQAWNSTEAMVSVALLLA